MVDFRIEHVLGREILDSRGRPTVEADVASQAAHRSGLGAIRRLDRARTRPSSSRDGDPSRYRGGGVRTAVGNVRHVIGPAVRGLPADDQAALDRRLIELDGTPTKARLGANATLAVSLAACRAAADARMALYLHIAGLCGSRPVVPLPMVNLISGGLHAGRQLDLQDVLIIPTGARDFATAIADAAAVHARLGEMVVAAGHQPLVADEGGWAPRLGGNREAVGWVATAITDTGVEAGIALDIAASQLLDAATGEYVLAADDRRLPSSDLVAEWIELAAAHHVLSIEDGLAEDDWDGWAELTRRAGTIQLVGDDLFATNAGRLRRGIEADIANAVLVKPNQAGTLTRGARRDPDRQGERVRDHRLGAIRRDRGRVPRRPRGRLRRGTDQGRLRHSVGATGEVEPAPPDRGGARRGVVCRGGRAGSSGTTGPRRTPSVSTGGRRRR